jgi:type I restriction enzyme R subunit
LRGSLSYFTILDFRKATELFADPDFDGEPVQVYQPKGEDPIEPPDEAPTGDALEGQAGAGEPGGLDGEGAAPAEGGGKRVKYVVGDLDVSIVSERVQYYGKDGKLITESLRDYSRNAIREKYASLDAFLKSWRASDRKQAILKELEERGVFFEELAKDVGKDLSAFDLVCHVAFDQPTLTRKERANNVRKRNYFTKYGDAARAVLEALLDKFANEHVDDIENVGVLKVQPLTTLGTPVELIERFGGKADYLRAVRELEDELFAAG